MLNSISPFIFQLPADNNPLSADVFIIHGNTACYVFDVGANEESLNLLKTLKHKTAIISHFHADHSTNLKNVEFDKVIQGKIDNTITINDGHKLEISNLTSGHCKNSIMLNVDNRYLFVGDSLYASTVNGKECYNVQKLKSTIDELKKTDTEFVIPSHENKILTKDEAISRLQTIYSKRNPSDSYIFVFE